MRLFIHNVTNSFLKSKFLCGTKCISDFKSVIIIHKDHFLKNILLFMFVIKVNIFNVLTQKSLYHLYKIVILLHSRDFINVKVLSSIPVLYANRSI